MTFELYFQINDNEPELQSAFDTKAEAEKYMQRLIDSKSRIKSWYIRKIQRDGYWLYDYGAHNAFYMIKEVEIKKEHDWDWKYAEEVK